MRAGLLETWQSAFLEVVQEPATAVPLKEASLRADRKAWTSLLTTAVVRSCEAIGLRAAGKGHRLDLLPQPQQEYLAIDVMAFPGIEPESECRWPLPVAAFELENAKKDDRVSYSLWKLLCVRAALRVLFAYRGDWEGVRDLVGTFQDDVIGGLTIEERTALRGDTVVVMGSRGEGDTFPWGYFKFWRLDTNLGRFEKL